MSVSFITINKGKSTERTIPVKPYDSDFEKICNQMVVRLLTQRNKESIDTILEYVRRIDTRVSSHTRDEDKEFAEMIRALAPESLENFGKELLQ